MAGEATKAGVATGNPYAAAAGIAIDAISGAGSTGASPSSAVQDYGSLGLTNKGVNVGNTGLNLGAILLPFQDNPANGGMGANIVSRWLDKNYSSEVARPLPAGGGSIADHVAPFVMPAVLGVGALSILILLMRRKRS